MTVQPYDAACMILYDTHKPVLDITSDDTFRHKGETKHNVKNNMDDLNHQVLFIPKPVLKQEYCTLFKQ